VGEFVRVGDALRKDPLFSSLLEAETMPQEKQKEFLAERGIVIIDDQQVVDDESYAPVCANPGCGRPVEQDERFCRNCDWDRFWRK